MDSPSLSMDFVPSEYRTTMESNVAPFGSSILGVSFSWLAVAVSQILKM